MSISKLIPFVQKRFVHRAPDIKYAPLWKKAGIDVVRALGVSGERMFQSPKLVEQILRVEAAMKEKGLVPFLHAMPAGSRVVTRIADEVFGKKPFFKYLRLPVGEFILPRAEAAIPKKEVRHPKPALLSVSYALTSGVRRLESAASWGFVNHFNQEQYFLLMAQLGLMLAGRKLSMGGALIGKYNQLKVGDFQVIGIPADKVERIVYDSMPYNVPTGESALEVATHPEKYADGLMGRGTHMATLIACKEMFEAVTVVTANDLHEVEEFCSGIAFKPIREVEVYRGLVSDKDTDFEEAQLQRRRELDRELEITMALFKEVRELPEVGIPDCDEEYPAIYI